MAKKKESIEHPAYQEEDIEIKTPQELEEAKTVAGVTTHEEALKRLEKFAEVKGEGQSLHEVIYEINQLKDKEKELYGKWAKFAEYRPNSPDLFCAASLYETGGDLENAARIYIQIFEEKQQKSWVESAKRKLLEIADSSVNPKGGHGSEHLAVETVKLSGKKYGNIDGIEESFWSDKASINKSITNLNLAKRIFEVLGMDTFEIDGKIAEYKISLPFIDNEIKNWKKTRSSKT